MENNFLMDFNQRLKDTKKNKSSINNMKSIPIVFIVGAPRSGTTIINQLLAAATDCAYIDNLAACFWEDPVIGLQFSNKLIKKRIYNGKSEFGQTSDLSEPHEFGAFWRSRLNYNDMTQQGENHYVDWQSLANELRQMVSVNGKPLVMKVFQLGWHINQIQTVLPEARWIYVNRKIANNALSLLNMRLKRTGNIDEWISSMPATCIGKYEGMPFHQVVSQVTETNKHLDFELSKLDKNSVIRISYDSLIIDTQNIIEVIAKQLGLNIRSEFFALNKIETKNTDQYKLPKEWVSAINEICHD